MVRHVRCLIVVGIVVVVVAAGVAWWRRSRDEERLARAARDAVAMGRSESARELIERWLNVRPRSAEAHALMALAALDGGDLAEVSRHLDQARDLGYPRDQLDRVHAIILARLGRLAEAEPMLARARAAEAGPDPRVDDALVRIYLQTYRLGEAAGVIRRWIREVPDDARPYVWLTEIDSRTEGADPNDRIEHFRAALARAPELDAARRGLAEALTEVHRNDEAEAEFQTYLARHPDDPVILAAAGRNAIELGDFDEAETRLNRALKNDPDNPDALVGLAEVDIRQGSLKPALKRLDDVLQADPIHQEALTLRASVRARLGDRDGARADRDALDQLRHDEAELLALRPRALASPGDSDLACQVAAWMFAHQRDDQGLRWAKIALASHPDHAPTCRLLADYYARQPGQAGLANYYRLRARTSASSSPDETRSNQ